MKHIQLMGCLLMMGMGSAPLIADTTLTPMEWQGEQVISLLDITEQVIEDFAEGNMGHVTLECPEGISLPFHIDLKGQFLGLEPTAPMPFNLKILKTCYIRCKEPQNFLFSTDLQTWKEFSEFFGGEVRVSLHVKDEGLVAGLELELNQQVDIDLVK